MAECPINLLSLCAGGGGLDHGVRLAIPTARTVCLVEREGFAVSELVRAMEEGRLDDAPIWSDLRTFDGNPWRGVVDCVIGGYPCQDFSLAGKRAGLDGARGSVWREVARVVGEVQPALVFFENVSGHLTLGWDSVAASLEGMGYRVAAGLFTASEIGAPHKRERLFILGVADGGRERGERRQACESRVFHDGTDAGRVEGIRELASIGGHVVAHGPVGGLRELRQPPGCDGQPDGRDAVVDHAGQRPAAVEEPESQRRSGGGTVADAAGREGRRNGTQRGPDRRAAAGRAGEDVQLFPPGPADLDRWRDILAERPELAPALDAETQQHLRGLAARMVGSRRDRLRLLGNGVVPICAAWAFVNLYASLRGVRQPGVGVRDAQ